jgi:hypothetical protein
MFYAIFVNVGFQPSMGHATNQKVAGLIPDGVIGIFH